MSRATIGTLALSVVCAVCFAFVPVRAAQDKDTEYATQLAQGNTALASHQWENALKAFKRASTARNKTSLDAHAGMARAYFGMGAYKNAAESWTDALEYAGDDVRAQATCHNQRGMALFSMAQKPSDKKVREAEQEFRLTLSLDPSLTVARYNLGVALMRQSRDEEGAAELRAYLESPSRGPELDEARKFLANPRRAREPFAPDFSVVTLTQERLALEDLRGKVVLLDFWASWCGPCTAATPGLVKLQKKFGDRAFTIVGISLDEQDPAWRAYVEKNKMTWPQYLDKGGRVARLFKIQPIPTYILIDHDGMIVNTQEGWNPAVDGWLSKLVEQLVLKAESAAPR